MRLLYARVHTIPLALFPLFPAARSLHWRPLQGQVVRAARYDRRIHA